jgi:hypothetical protein
MGGLSIAIGALVPSNVPNPRLLSRKKPEYQNQERRIPTLANNER